MYYSINLKFDWDEEKNRSNFIKHAVWFDEAKTLWADESSVEFYDLSHSGLDDRYIRIGFSTKARLLLVVFIDLPKLHKKRIVSARKATKKEIGKYEK